MGSGCGWQTSLTVLHTPGKLPRQAPLGLYVERVWKVPTLKHGGLFSGVFFFFFLFVYLLRVRTPVGVG